MLWLYLVLCVTSVLGKNTPSVAVAPTVRLRDGNLMPRLGLGTWLGFIKMGPEEEVRGAVEAAIDAGYRLIDTANIYITEEQVALGMKKKLDEGVVKREEMFITTKLWNDAHRYEAVLPALKNSLQKLELEYVDLYLIHFPIAIDSNGSVVDVDYLETWRGMIEVQRQGLTNSIGVSNFNISQLQRLIEQTGVTPAVLQVEVNLNIQQPELLEFCKAHNIVVMGYTPFGSIFPQKAAESAPPPRVDDEELVHIAKKYNKTVPQVVLRYLFELGVVPIPKSVKKNRVEENIDIFDFELTPEERNLLKSYDANYKIVNVALWKDSPYYPF
ncbi:aldo-keto reductase AKR2E4-like isoform X2 [Danaus plexippus]|uniref:Aldo-keto reductase n=1 Tax=Danaus plexippus plexippus TaxID=278856 RepID=A0A212FE35_DANPL|nr:aldo-keto reductase AKR2E4-like isoform X1 [Danaus plexippus plexippus]XP_061381226.1 aldo-keto reductase AKR2E4-like isoform X2 [Danaus plexippus]OWR52019.1 aldo-keto reductase [Danaus plexippus plexippus]